MTAEATTPTLTRRAALIAAAAVPAVALAPRAARAAAPMQGAAQPGFHRFPLGEMEVTTLLVGTRPMENPNGTFGLNASPEDFAALAQANFLPADMSVNFFTPTLVNTGAELVLFDTGLAPEAITAALTAAGVTPDQVDVVVLTHMHGDHIGGLAGEAPTFTNARYVTGAVEHNHWSGAGNEGFDTKVKPLSDKMTMLDDGGSVAAGISAIAAFGHSPGHMAYRLESGGKSLVITADTVNHYVFSMQRPDWEVRFDMDKAAGAATRRKLLGMLAADRTPFIGYHMPFPAVGYVEAQGEGFRFVPASYQQLL
ncbi:MAG: MBL fold metallo-hydrolase [Rhodobacterales bacterium 65-51]|uniref:MBL fold metallo-hydrolase n=1 Tax=uncultured Gemmobacter sp. TaxID=1095917 RepID=UPI0009592AFA|nr:MBL fold metallo-hydrolase [uncultured Gemmobacter sp.]OJY25470.1 MAG: MBL fold metallo-hydrolase [Rhodobacterales bacterium 65-51]